MIIHQIMQQKHNLSNYFVIYIIIEVYTHSAGRRKTFYCLFQPQNTSHSTKTLHSEHFSFPQFASFLYQFRVPLYQLSTKSRKDSFSVCRSRYLRYHSPHPEHVKPHYPIHYHAPLSKPLSNRILKLLNTFFICYHMT